MNYESLCIEAECKARQIEVSAQVVLIGKQR